MIAIVGGGLSGLLLLDALSEAGVESLLFEARDEPGGVVVSRTLDGPNGPAVVDLGPQRVRLTPGLGAVVDRLDLRAELLEAPRGLPFTIHHGGRLHPAPTSVGAALTSGLVSPLGKVRALADLVTAPPREEESVAAALRRKLGPEIYLRLAGPILGGLYGSDPEAMDARHTLVPMVRRAGGSRSLLLALRRASRGEGLPVVTFREGMATLPRALAERHTARIRFGSPVETIRATSGGGFELRTGGATLRARGVVLTLPAPEAARVLAEAFPDAAARLATLRYNPLAVVPLVVPSGGPPVAVGSGFKMTLSDPRATRGVTSHDALFGRTGLYTAFLGGMGEEALVARDDEALLEIARADFRDVTGRDAVPLLVHRTWMPAWDRSWSALEGMALPPDLHIMAAYSDRPGIPGRLEGARRLAGRLTPR